MKNKSNSNELKKASAVLFAAGGISAFTLLAGTNFISILAAALFTAAGGALLIINAIMHPESIQRPDIQPPQINLPHDIKSYHNAYATNVKVPGIINVNEWFIVNLFQKDKVLTKRQRIRGTLCCLLWIATVAIYLPVSFYMDNFEISWIAFIGAAFIHALIYGLLSIGERKGEIS